MKAVLSAVPGGPETLRIEEIALPEPAPGEVQIAVHAVGVNFPDLLVIEDKYQFKPDRPFSPGAELAGVIDRVGEGEGVSGLRPGDRVMALPLWGAMAEHVCVPAARCHKLPDEVAFDVAAALQMTYGTALYGLAERGAIAPGERLLVLGAAGGVGLAAVELGQALGAHVAAAASTAEKVAVAREHGAAEGVVYLTGALDRDAQKTLTAEFRRALGGEGADLVFDTVGGDYTEPALRAVAWLGRLLVVGFPAGIARIPANLPLLKSCDIRGVFWGAAVDRDPAAHHAAMDRLLDLLSKGAIRPRVHARYPLDRAGEAIAALSTRNVVGKVVVTVR